MKKLFFTAAILAASVVGANADTKMPIPTVEEAQQQGWEALWGDYQYGYVMPENYVLVDNEEVKVSLNKAANVATTCQVKDYDINLQMGSAWNRESNDAVWTLESVYAGMKQPYAVLTLEPKMNGKISFTYCRGKNSNTTMFVWDTMGNNDLGYFVTANSTFFDETADAGLDPLPHTVTVNVRMGHKYYIFGAETGANTDFYGLAFTPYSDANYGGSTGIENVVTDTMAKPADGRIYTIDGRYVGKDKNALGKGLYIMDGKKFVAE